LPVFFAVAPDDVLAVTDWEEKKYHLLGMRIVKWKAEPQTGRNNPSTALTRNRQSHHIGIA
jgi:hypothetical protein